MAAILTEHRYQYCAFNVETGKPETVGTEQVYTEGEIHLEVPHRRAAATHKRNRSPVRRPLKVESDEEVSDEEMSDEEMSDEEEEPARIVPVRAAPIVPVRAAPVPAGNVKCENEDQFWDIISQVGWKSPTEGAPNNPHVISQIDVPSRVVFRRLYDQFINTLRSSINRITRNENESIKIASHFIGLGRDTYYGVVEDSTFIVIMYEEGMIGNFDELVLRKLA